MKLDGVKIVLGVSGSIALYKAISLGRKFLKSGAQIRVAMTENATKFITPLTFRSALNAPVVVDEFAEQSHFEMEHISWSRWADIFIIAPATANVLAKCACGIADDFLTTSILAAKCPVVFVPAMNSAMFDNPATKRNMNIIEESGYYVISPDTGELACGESGKGRFPEIDVISNEIESILAVKKILSGKKIMITAGPTRQFIDSVRFISNPSTGKMGFALARIATMMGAEVTLIHGPTQIPIPNAEKIISVVSAEEMSSAVMENYPDVDVVIMSAAVSDWTPVRKYSGKMKKGTENIDIELTRTVDILAELGKHKGGKILCGFAIESDDIVSNARKKLTQKNLDIIVANPIGDGTGFSASTNSAILIYPDSEMEEIELMPKMKLARIILERIARILSE